MALIKIIYYLVAKVLSIYFKLKMTHKTCKAKYPITVNINGGIITTI